MSQQISNPPHGGKLTQLMATEERQAEIKQQCLEWTDISLNERQLCDLELLATGAFSPLEGFMGKADYESVLEKMQLADGTLWPIPIALDIDATLADKLAPEQPVALRDPEGFLLACLHITDIWTPDRKGEAQAIYGTEDLAHPGVNYLLREGGAAYVGGRLEVTSIPIHYDFKQLRLAPREVRQVARKLGWQRVAAFFTRNPIHRPQFEMTVRAMREARVNLLVLPFENVAKTGDFDHFTRVRCYREMMRYYPPDSVSMSLLPLSQRMAGPRNALLHAILARNYGCTHMIIGPKHGSPEDNPNGEPFYASKSASRILEENGAQIGIQPLVFPEIVYLPFEDEFCTSDEVPENGQSIHLTNADIRKRIRTGRKVPRWASFPEVISELKRTYPSPRRQGFTVFMTGLSGAGKSTIAKILHARFLEVGGRPVTLLDGDIVRHNLSSELTFSKEHRDINVRRIGFVASEITKNRGIAICAPIAPYIETRRFIRCQIEASGGFIEVHIATPLQECERRDRKGIYAKARAGLIKGFTGIDDPYEEPLHPEVRVDTTHLTPDESVQQILLVIGQMGFI